MDGRWVDSSPGIRSTPFQSSVLDIAGQQAQMSNRDDFDLQVVSTLSGNETIDFELPELNIHVPAVSAAVLGISSSGILPRRSCGQSAVPMDDHMAFGTATTVNNNIAVSETLCTNNLMPMNMNSSAQKCPTFASQMSSLSSCFLDHANDDRSSISFVGNSSTWKMNDAGPKKAKRQKPLSSSYNTQADHNMPQYRVPYRTQSQRNNHILAERQRREEMNEKFSILRTLLPNMTKKDKASIVTDTINYVRELERKVKHLQDCKSSGTNGCKTQENPSSGMEADGHAKFSEKLKDIKVIIKGGGTIHSPSLGNTTCNETATIIIKKPRQDNNRTQKITKGCY